MRLHRLRVQAFGPFAEPVTLDLDELSEAGIFLIHGATGSGKTSLLDAVCFALYGRVPGLRSAGETLRSHHAEPDAVPEVELELTIGDRRLRVTRSADHHRPKLRGSGLTLVRGQVRLDVQAGAGWTTVSTRADEVGDILKDSLGMGLDQFATVVLLPQGQFATFLRANPEERRAVLERLFDVSRYTGVEIWLAEQRRRTAGHAGAAKAALLADLVRVDDVLARLPADLLAEPPGWAEAVADGTLTQILDVVHGRVTDHATGALAALGVAERDAELATQALADGERTAQARSRGVDARAVLARHDAGDLERRQAATVLDRAERAGRVAGDLRALEQASSDQHRARTHLDRCLAALADAAVPLGELSPEAALIRVRDFDGTVAEIARLAQANTGRQHRRRAAVTTIDRVQAELSAVDARDVALAAEAGRLELRAEELLGLADSLAARSDAAARAELLVSTRADADRLIAATKRLETAHLAAARVALAQADRLLDLRQRRLDGMAAELAAGLVPGTDCPVCGSAEHPRPATTAHVVTAADVAAAEAALAPLDERVRSIERELAATAGLLDAAVEVLDGDSRVLEQLQEAAALAGAAAREARDAVTETAQVQRLLARCRADREALAGVRTEHLAALAVAQTLVDELDATAQHEATALREVSDRHTEGCPCASLAQESDRSEGVGRRHQQVLALLTEARDAVSAEERARSRHAEQAARTSQICRAEGFDDPAEVRAASRPTAEVAALRDRLTAAATEAAAAQATLADDEVAQALTGVVPDLEALAALSAAAKARRAAATRTHALAEQAARDIDALADQVSACATAARDAKARADVVAGLADVVAGLGADNTLRMKLSAFVLAGRLERVVELANERLQRMGDGRFRLEHSDRLASGGRRSGLGLVIDDLWTGQTRDTATLSGGESFVASLALALGLADAVREESGGIDLHTLFIDEGFGSLDAESLEQVLGVLDRLQEGGRAVGVVSHVPALRDRIQAQVRVDKTRAGSRVRRVSGPAA